MKKVLSLVLALTLVLTLGVPAFAGTDTNINTASGLTSGAKTEITGTTEGMTIGVTVPSAGSIVVNPYNLDVAKPGAQASDPKVKDTILSTTQRITSTTKAPLAVSVTIEGKPKDGITMATEPQRATSTPVAAKSIFLGLEMVEEAPAATVSSSEPAWKVTLTKKEDGSNELKIGEGAKAAVVTNSATTTEDICTLAASPDGTKKSAAAYHLIGDTGIDPANPWASTDTVAVSLTFTFKVLGNK